MDAAARERFAFCLSAMSDATSQCDLTEARRGADAAASEMGMTFDGALKALRSGWPSDDEADKGEGVDTDDEPIASYPSTRGEIERVAAVKAVLATDPERSDRDVAREIGCSPTTVGRARCATGLQRVMRKVTRGGSNYEMVAAQQALDP